MPDLEIRLFGPPAVLVGGRPLPPLKTRKGLWLLALLVLRAGREVDRRWLAGTLWPDSDESAALAYLRQSLTDLRRALGDAAYRLQSPAPRSLRIDLEGAWCDLAEFDARAASASRPDREALATLHVGLLLEGCSEEWVLHDREVRLQQFLGALEHLASEDLAEDRAEAAVRRLKQIIAAEPTREAAYALLMRALAARGEAAAVVEVFRDLRLTLRRELNCSPRFEIQALFETLRQEARHKPGSRPSPAARTEPLPPTLPRFLSEFLGRTREIAAVRRCLASSRLVTLTGPGGVGKTRLAAEVAELEWPGFEQGAVFVDLAAITDPDQVTFAVASALGLQDVPRTIHAEGLATVLANREQLLLIDNCEHVLPGCVALGAELLRRGPGLKILATSRKRLGLAGETEWRVPPLETPPASLPSEEDESTQLLLSNEAVALFLDRARRVRSDLECTPDLLRSAAEVCRSLDGVPLALELAAGRLHALTIPQLAERLAHRFRLLVGGDPTAPDRQRTLRAVLDWSHELLNEGQRRLLRRLAVFSSGWTLEAAETVCSDSGEPDPDLLDRLAELVDHSLIVFIDSGHQGRYRFLETVRQYALEQLREAGEEEKFRQHHFRYFLGWSGEAARFLTKADAGVWMDRLETDHDNLRAALDWSIGHPAGIREGMRLAGNLFRFWYCRGHTSEGRRRYQELLKLDAGKDPGQERLAALVGLGRLARREADFSTATGVYTEALHLSRELGDLPNEAECLASLGGIGFFQGRLAEAASAYQAALDLINDPTLPSTQVAIHGKGLLAVRAGRFDEAFQHFRTCLDASAAAGNRSMEATIQLSLGNLEHRIGGSETSIHHHREALRLFRELGDLYQVIMCLNNLGVAAEERGEPEVARRFYAEALREAAAKPGCCFNRVLSHLLDGAASIAFLEGDLDSVVTLVSASEGHLESIGVQLAPTDRRKVDDRLRQAETIMGSEKFRHAWETGQSFGAESAIPLALAVVERRGLPVPS